MNESTQTSYGAGTITVHMNSSSATEIAAPDIRFGDYNAALTSCFSRKELETIDGGANAEVNIDFLMKEEIDNEGEEKQFLRAIEKAEKTYGTLHEAVYLETQATKSVDGYEYTDLEYLSEDVELQIDIPLYLAAEGRHYYVMTNDMGVCLMEEDVDADADTLSISTHSLSTSLLLYQDAREALRINRSSFRIKTEYFFIFAILVLLIIWRVVERSHKKDKK